MRIECAFSTKRTIPSGTADSSSLRKPCPVLLNPELKFRGCNPIHHSTDIHGGTSINLRYSLMVKKKEIVKITFLREQRATFCSSQKFLKGGPQKINIV